MRPPILVQAITHLAPGGAQQVVFSLIRTLDPARFELHLCACPQGAWLDEARALPAVFHPIPHLVREVAPLKDLRALWELYALLRRLRRANPGRPILVHTHAPKAGLLGRLAARAAGVRVLHTLHGLPFHDGQSWARRTLYRTFEGLGYRLGGGAVVSVTEANRRKLDQAGWAVVQEVEVIPPGIDLSPIVSFAPQPRKRLAAWGVRDDERVVGMVANLKPPKDPLDLLRAMAPLLARDPGLHLVFVGDGPLRAELETAVAELPQARQVHLMGWQGALRELYPELDVMALDSQSEGLPMVLVEALAAGVPVITTDVGGVAEVVRDGVNGRIVPPRDPQAMEAALRRMLAELDSWRTRVKATRDALAPFDLPQVTARYLALYERVLAGKS